MSVAAYLEREALEQSMDGGADVVDEDSLSLHFGVSKFLNGSLNVSRDYWTVYIWLPESEVYIQYLYPPR